VHRLSGAQKAQRTRLLKAKKPAALVQNQQPQVLLKISVHSHLSPSIHLQQLYNPYYMVERRHRILPSHTHQVPALSQIIDRTHCPAGMPAARQPAQRAAPQGAGGTERTIFQIARIHDTYLGFAPLSPSFCRATTSSTRRGYFTPTRCRSSTQSSSCRTRSTWYCSFPAHVLMISFSSTTLPPPSASRKR
jgi:hypothetical protein